MAKKEKRELLTKEFDFEATIHISVYDFLKKFTSAEKRQLAQELIDEILIDDDLPLTVKSNSLEDEFKRRHFTQVQNDYSLEELEQLLPNKKG